MIHGRIVVNACVNYRKQIFIAVGDIYPDRKNIQIFCHFETSKMVKVGHFEFDPDKISQNSWEDCS